MDAPRPRAGGGTELRLKPIAAIVDETPFFSPKLLELVRILLDFLHVRLALIPYHTFDAESDDRINHRVIDSARQLTIGFWRKHSNGIAH